MNPANAPAVTPAAATPDTTTSSFGAIASGLRDLATSKAAVMTALALGLAVITEGCATRQQGEWVYWGKDRDHRNHRSKGGHADESFTVDYRLVDGKWVPVSGEGQVNWDRSGKAGSPPGEIKGPPPLAPAR